MAKTISQLQDDIQRKIHGTNLSGINSILDIIGEAGGNVIADVDPLETIRSAQITNGLYDDVYDYAAPADLKGNKILDIRKQINRNPADSFSQRLSQEFDSRKLENTFQVKHVNGTKSLRISKDVKGSAVSLHNMDSLTSNGTWAATGDGTNATQDTVNYIQGGASINFDVNASGSAGAISNTTMNSIDLSAHDEKSSIFVRVYIPDTSIVTNFILRWGNDLTTNYWTRTVTTNHEGGSFETGWNILRFDWNGATEQGTVAPATIDSIRFTVTYDGTADTDFRVDAIVSALEEIFYVDYYSKFLFKSSAGTYLEIPTDTTDTINLDTDSYQILLYECCYLISQEIQDENTGVDLTFFEKEKEKYRKIYQRNNPSQSIRPQDFWYRV